MIARASQLHLPTLRDDPADAEAVSHKLLVRGGFIRQVAGGLWTFMPLGWRVHRKIEQIIREELDAFGAREIRSYKELPQIWYHFQTKDRDEPRPRAGLLRVREFIMKDGYSFDRDEAGLDVSFRKHAVAYERIWERCGLEAHGVQAESGMMGGSESFDYLAPSGSGENVLVRCENGDYAADLEIARGIPSDPTFPPRLERPEQVETPGATTIEALAELLTVDAAAT